MTRLTLQGTIGSLPHDPNLPDLNTFGAYGTAAAPDAMVTETSIAEIDAMAPETESMVDIAS